MNFQVALKTDGVVFTRVVELFNIRRTAAVESSKPVFFLKTCALH